MSRHQKLPTDWHEREKLREKGQFWTPMWVAEAMVAYISQSSRSEVFDPAVGTGAFFLAAKNVLGKNVRLSGTEIDATVLAFSKDHGLTNKDLTGTELTDFMDMPADKYFPAIIANPPYIRHHRLPRAYKEKLRQFCEEFTGFTLDGRAGLHIYFLLKALSHLEKNGSLAFIMPADTCEGVFAGKLWGWITTHFCLEYVVTFAESATPFPGVDTNAMIFCIRRSQPLPAIRWIQCLNADGGSLQRILSGQEITGRNLIVQSRQLAEALATGLSRPLSEGLEDTVPLGTMVRVMRGIATGANHFFFMTLSEASVREIPERFLARAIGRTRDVESDVIRPEDMDILEASGRPTRLLMLNGYSVDELPLSVQCYIKHGEQQKLHERPLLSMRNPWFWMETRRVPPFLFAYLGRRNTRFIRNCASVLPLTGFLCVYPKAEFANKIEELWRVLNDPRTLANLARVGKSYGAGAIKVEPRNLERLPVPVSVLLENGILLSSTPLQMEFSAVQPASFSSMASYC
jgi:adenine-specific DNA-methyltransferase